MAAKHFHHLGLAIPDVPVQKKFYEDFGLIGEETENRAIMRCHGRDQDQLVLTEGAERKLHHVSYGTDEEGLAAVKKSVEASDTAKLIDCPTETPYDGLWIEDFEGDVFNMIVAEPAASKGGRNPSVPHDAFQANGPGHYDRVNKKGSISYETQPEPHRLGHMVQFTTSLTKKIDFYQKILGLKLTDTCEGLIAFMRTPGGCDHHTVAFLQADQPGFHHASFEMANVDQLNLNALRMIDKGHSSNWGFGRHVVGSNFFHYLRDPWNGLIEFFSDIDYIPADYDWEARDWPEERAFSLWGPEVPDDFIENFEAPSHN